MLLYACGNNPQWLALIKPLLQNKVWCFNLKAIQILQISTNVPLTLCWISNAFILQATTQQFLNNNHHNGNATEIVKMVHTHVATI